MRILVTGGAGFIGSNFVRRTLEDAYPGLEGADVVVLDALTYSGNLENLAPVADSPRYEFVHGDIRDADLLDRILPGVDAIVHFAAESHVDRSVRDSGIFVETNVLGIVHTFAPFVAAMRAARTGTLAGIASVAGFRGLPGSGAYSASKAAAIAYLESLRVELVGSGVAVVTVCPGFVATPMTARNPYPMPFLLPPDRAAALIARAVARRRRFYVLPWPMAWIGRLLRVAPRSLYDRVLAGRKRKPRDAG